MKKEGREDRILLIVEDDECLRGRLSRALARRGYVPVETGSVREALASAEKYRPGYVLLDLNLAGESGLALIEPLLAISPLARIVVLTGFACIPTAVRAIKLGASQYLAKPANADEISRALSDDTLKLPEQPSSELLTVRGLEWEYIQRALAEHGGNVTATAEALKMHRRSLQRKLARRRPYD
ncbi:MAG: response regulator [Betaproteobacteria bacterium]|nr:response regulator [Betaproteobacteria bacterium]